MSTKDTKKQQSNDDMTGRRTFLKSAVALGSIPTLAGMFAENALAHENALSPLKFQGEVPKSVIGQYGPWASSLPGKGPRPLSFRNAKWKDLKSWKAAALPRVKELVASPEVGGVPKVTVVKSYQYDGLHIEELQWSLPYGRPTSAILLKPANSKEPLPAILGLHDHGGNKYFGRRKITRTSDDAHPMMKEHQENYYEGKAWANEIAKRGYVVLVPDNFTFGSRRVYYQDVDYIRYGACNVEGRTDENPESPENINAYNQWAGEHEHIMSKSLFCGGTTWPGVLLAEDQRALDVLCARKDVDVDNVGCSGLSGGGLRTVYLAGLDHRVKCAVGVGFMTTWDDFLLYRSFNHTWMTYTPLLPREMDFSEIIGLRVPLPTMILNNSEDQLFTPPEMKKAEKILRELFDKAGASEKLEVNFYPGPHKYDAKMQADAFHWFDRWLKG